jgi:sugar lactone lactonase YvrE
MQARIAAKRENLLGEGPCWVAAEHRLYWVDIRQRLLEWLDPATGEAGVFRLERRASAMAPRKAGGLVLATDGGFAIFDTKTGAFSLKFHPEPERVSNRSNDGHVDLEGRFWTGTMDDTQERCSGAVYRLDPDWSCTRVLDGLGIPNTLAAGADGKTFYLADSREQVLYAYDLSSEGELSRPRVFASTVGEVCTPDGSAVDAEGYLWNVQWGGWHVVRYAADGRIDRVLDLPVGQPSSCAFGGEDLGTLYITSARDGLSPEDLEQQPLAGSVFAVEPGVRGLKLPLFAG